MIGVTEVLGYPPDLLKDLKPLAGEDPLGVLDPLNQLKPLLKAAAVECQDLEDTGLENYHGKLAIIGPFQCRAQMREEPAEPHQGPGTERGRRGLDSAAAEKSARNSSLPSTLVPEGKGAVVVVQADQVANLAENPQAQLNLIQLARLALHPEPPQLPHLTPSQ